MSRIFKCLLAGMIFLMVIPVILVGATLTLFVAVLVGVPLTAPHPPPRRGRSRESTQRLHPAPAKRAVPALLLSEPTSR